MTKIFKIFTIIMLCLTIIFSAGCSLLSSDTSSDATELINSGQLQYPATNELFRYNIYTTYASISEYIGNDKTVVIPDELNKKPVLVIEANAFAENTVITSVTLGKNVYSIGECAFSGCPALSKITLPDSLSEISNSAFANCTSLKQIDIPYNVSEISESLCYGCSSLEKVTITHSTSVTKKTIMGNAFNECKNLTYVWLPEEISEIELSAFGEGLKNLTIYSSLGSTAASFCAENLINFVILDEDSFDDIAIVSSKSILPNYLTVNDSVTCGNWFITLTSFKEYSEIGTYQASEGNVYIVLNFNATNVSTSSQIFNFLETKCIASGFDKLPFYADIPSISGVHMLSGLAKSNETISGYLIFEVNKNWTYVAVDFSGLDLYNSEFTSAYDSTLAVYSAQDYVSEYNLDIDW